MYIVFIHVGFNPLAVPAMEALPSASRLTRRPATAPLLSTLFVTSSCGVQTWEQEPRVSRPRGMCVRVMDETENGNEYLKKRMKEAIKSEEEYRQKGMRNYAVRIFSRGNEVWDWKRE